VDAGADYVVTQMFLIMLNTLSLLIRPEQWESPFLLFRNKTHCGAKTLTNTATNFRIDLPEDLIQAVDGCKIMQIRQVGIEWAIQQSLELKAAGVPCALLFWENLRISKKSHLGFLEANLAIGYIFFRLVK
jgi:methylenetetrahydrofolate reductase (NADPH)